jgi:hypothetical protein
LIRRRSSLRTRDEGERNNAEKSEHGAGLFHFFTVT